MINEKQLLINAIELRLDKVHKINSQIMPMVKRISKLSDEDFKKMNLLHNEVYKLNNQVSKLLKELGNLNCQKH